jgi:hypothetical protein
MIPLFKYSILLVLSFLTSSRRSDDPVDLAYLAREAPPLRVPAAQVALLGSYQICCAYQKRRMRLFVLFRFPGLDSEIVSKIL